MRTSFVGRRVPGAAMGVRGEPLRLPLLLLLIVWWLLSGLPLGVGGGVMRTMIELEKDLDLCPICGAAGTALCIEEDGQYVLDHWGRPAQLPRGIDGVAPTNVEALAVVA